MSDEQALFTAETGRFRRELLAYCYRMVGSASEAEDLVQETYLRAWRAYAGFERRASIRSWLYKIASNVCLTDVQSRKRRVLPSVLAGPCETDRPPTLVAEDVSWIEPMPDAWIIPRDPAEALIARESLRLALIASLQHFPARQRAIFILREVLEFSAEETAEVLECTVASVKSGLQRVRARLDDMSQEHELLEPTDPRAKALLDGYMAAFDHADASLLQKVLRADATLEATPFCDWRAGRQQCIGLLTTYVLGAPCDWKMTATIANGQPAAVVYRRDAEGVLCPNGIVVLSATTTGVSKVVAFHHDPALVALFA